MRKFIAAFSVVLIFCRFSSPTPTLCEQIKQKTPKLSNYNFTEEGLHKIDRKNLLLIDSSFSSKLFNQENTLDSTFAVGYFDISPTRMGFVSCYTTYECDHRIATLCLHVIDNCDSVVYENNSLATTDDGDPYYYYMSAKLSTDKRTLTHVTKHTSQWVEVTDENKKDTLFTETYKIDLSLAKIDTVYRKATFRLMK